MGISSHSTDSTRTAGRARTWLVGGFVVLWLAVQVANPLWRRTSPMKRRFGWQMYSGWRDEVNPSRGVRFVGVDADGKRVNVRHGRYIVRYRPEIAGGFVERVSARICRAEPSLQTVEAVLPGRVLAMQSCAAVRR